MSFPYGTLSKVPGRLKISSQYADRGGDISQITDVRRWDGQSQCFHSQGRERKKKGQHHSITHRRSSISTMRLCRQHTCCAMLCSCLTHSGIERFVLGTRKLYSFRLQFTPSSATTLKEPPTWETLMPYPSFCHDSWYNACI